MQAATPPDDGEPLLLAALHDDFQSALTLVPRRQRPVGTQHVPQRRHEVILVQPRKSFRAPHPPRERRSLLGDLLGLHGMALGPLELFAQIRKVRLDRDVVLPRHEEVVEPVLRGGNVVEEHPGQRELLDGARPRRPAPSAEVDVVFVLGLLRHVHVLADGGDAQLGQVQVFFIFSRGHLDSVHVDVGKFDVHPWQRRLPGLRRVLARLQLRLRRQQHPPPTRKQLVVSHLPQRFDGPPLVILGRPALGKRLLLGLDVQLVRGRPQVREHGVQEHEVGAPPYYLRDQPVPVSLAN
mmetsp:Transcript_31283/g.66572  ORF Transcript_31283/g.66572 Transcript_31283/m.66572 type:complete len:295 (-) Transcript_31283:1277-2161(-)